ncbi:MAG: metal-dependent transcriptional regulator [Candidatus Diapherotrites archaeon]|nr:metal-dependent transcriptional regulator [Candidatus Diapherotrites archaeon]
MVNQSRLDYVRAIFILSGRLGEVRGKGLSEYLGVSKNTVSTMLKRLRAQKLVLYEEYGAVSLTKKGERLAKDLTARHRLIELFLTRVLKRNPKTVHGEADLLEHAFSEQSLKSMRKLLGNPKFDPHGKTIFV